MFRGNNWLLICFMALLANSVRAHNDCEVVKVVPETYENCMNMNSEERANIVKMCRSKIATLCMVQKMAPTFSKELEEELRAYGPEIPIAEAPYVVQLRTAAGTLRCVGTLISAMNVVTTKSCLDRLGEDALVVGDATASNDTGVQRTIESVMSHPQADVSVIRVDSPMTGYDLATATVELCDKPLQGNDSITVSGWGKFPNLRSANRTISQSREQCERDNSNGITKIRIDKWSICSSVINDKASGKAGSPAIHDGRLCAIAAYNFEPTNYPRIYTDVYAVREFIEKASKIMFLENFVKTGLQRLRK